MLRTFRRSSAWRVVAVLIMVMALALPMMPVAAFAAAADAPAFDGRTYVVKGGDTLGELARYFGTTVSAIMRANDLSSSRIYVGQVLWIPAATPTHSCKQVYWVKHGDNLSRVAAWFGINTYALAAANGLSNASLIYPGQRLCIPNQYASGGDDHSGGNPGGGCYYTVKQGDNLSRIASWYGTSVHHLSHVNHIANPRVIIPGQRLYVC